MVLAAVVREAWKHCPAAGGQHLSCSNSLYFIALGLGLGRVIITVHLAYRGGEGVGWGGVALMKKRIGEAALIISC